MVMLVVVLLRGRIAINMWKTHVENSLFLTSRLNELKFHNEQVNTNVGLYSFGNRFINN